MLWPQRPQRGVVSDSHHQDEWWAVAVYLVVQLLPVGPDGSRSWTRLLCGTSGPWVDVVVVFVISSPRGWPVASGGGARIEAKEDCYGGNRHGWLLRCRSASAPIGSRIREAAISDGEGLWRRRPRTCRGSPERLAAGLRPPDGVRRGDGVLVPTDLPLLGEVAYAAVTRCDHRCVGTRPMPPASRPVIRSPRRVRPSGPGDAPALRHRTDDLVRGWLARAERLLKVTATRRPTPGPRWSAATNGC